MHLLPVVEGNRTFIEWKVQLDTAPQDADRWQTLFQSWIPDWTAFARESAGPSGGLMVRPLLRPVFVVLRSRAAENPGAFRRQIRLQRLPRHEGDILAFGVGADRVR